MSGTDTKKDVKAADLRGDFLAGLLDSTNLVVYLKDTEGRYIYVNRRYERLSTFPRAALLGKRDPDFFKPEVAKLFRSQDGQVMAHRGPLEFEETIPLPGGELSFITEKFPLLDEKGEVCAVGGFCTEITSQKNRADESLAEERERLAVTMRSISEGVVATDTKGAVTMLNSAGEELTGLTQKEAAGRDIDAVLPAADKRQQGAFGRLVRQTLAAKPGRGAAKAVTITAAGGAAHTLLPAAGAVRDRRGNVIGAVISLRNVTQSRRLEAEARQVACRITRAREAEKKLFATSLQDTIAALQTGMSSLLLLAEEDIRAGEKRGALSKIDEARKMLKRAICAVNGVCAENWPHSLAIAGLEPALRELLARFCTRSNIRVVSDFRLPAGTPAPESALAGNLYRIAQEALSNAEKHSGAKKLEFSLDLKDDRITLTTRDDGRGFDVKKAGNKKPGLGLKIMAEEAAAAGGRLSVTSRPGRGTLVSATLPLRGKSRQH
ncbi:MAG TPA: PAS domain-containing protein [Elusimicrobiales bacterium]|nr:PAS domain-containing protein [Elusimicrobiales bacterium]